MSRRVADDIRHLWRCVRASVLVFDWRESGRLEWIYERSMGGRVYVSSDNAEGRRSWKKVEEGEMVGK